jgi:hypothetical protein
VGAVIWIFVAIWIRLVGCDLLWVAGMGCGEWFVGLLLAVAIWTG